MPRASRSTISRLRWAPAEPLARRSQAAAVSRQSVEIMLDEFEIRSSGGLAVQARIDDATAGLDGELVTEVVRGLEHQPGGIDRRCRGARAVAIRVERLAQHGAERRHG